eukprot:312413-Hanusia_phi.AAC.1
MARGEYAHDHQVTAAAAELPGLGSDGRESGDEAGRDTGPSSPAQRGASEPAGSQASTSSSYSRIL